LTSRDVSRNLAVCLLCALFGSLFLGCSVHGETLSIETILTAPAQSGGWPTSYSGLKRSEIYCTPSGDLHVLTGWHKLSGTIYSQYYTQHLYMYGRAGSVWTVTEHLGAGLYGFTGGVTNDGRFGVIYSETSGGFTPSVYSQALFQNEEGIWSSDVWSHKSVAETSSVVLDSFGRFNAISLIGDAYCHWYYDGLDWGLSLVVGDGISAPSLAAGDSGELGFAYVGDDGGIWFCGIVAGENSVIQVAPEGSLSRRGIVSDSQGSFHLLYARPSPPPADATDIVHATNASGEWLATVLTSFDGDVSAPFADIDSDGVLHVVLDVAGQATHGVYDSEQWYQEAMDNIPSIDDMCVSPSGLLHVLYREQDGESSILRHGFETTPLALPNPTGVIVGSCTPGSTLCIYNRGGGRARDPETFGGSSFSVRLPHGSYDLFFSKPGCISSAMWEVEVDADGILAGDRSLEPVVSPTWDISAWIQPTAFLTGSSTFEDNSELFSAILAGAYEIGDDSSTVQTHSAVQGSWVSHLVSAAHQQCVGVYATVFDQQDDKRPDGTTQPTTKTDLMLDDPDKMEAYIDSLVELAVRGEFEGIDVDHEEILGCLEGEFTTFVRRLAFELDRHGKVLSATLQFPLSGRYQDYSRIGAPATSNERSPDEIRVMCYDNNYNQDLTMDIGSYHSAPSDVEKWMQEAENDHGIPKNQLIMALPLYAYYTKINSEHNSVTFKWVKDLVEQYEIDPIRGETHLVPHFECPCDKGIVWYEDARSIEEKLLIGLAQGVEGVCFWRLGDEDPAVWPVLASVQDGSLASHDVQGDLNFDSVIDHLDVRLLLQAIGGVYAAILDLDCDGDIDVDDAVLLAEYVIGMRNSLPCEGK